MDYYASYKNSKDPSLLRKELVSYALTYGNKKAARHFQTTVKTVRATADNKRINVAVELNASIASLTPSRRLSNI